jgi:hypothetical protein
MAEDPSPEHARLIRKLETIAVLSNARLMWLGIQFDKPTFSD